MNQYTEPMSARVKTPRMKRPEKADRTRSERVKQRDNDRNRSRSRKQLRFN